LFSNYGARGKGALQGDVEACVDLIAGRMTPASCLVCLAGFVDLLAGRVELPTGIQHVSHGISQIPLISEFHGQTDKCILSSL